MKNFQRIIIAIISIFSLFFIFSSQNVYAHDFEDLETKIIAASSEKKIKKLQTFFTQLDLYSGPIDGKYDSVLPSLLSYQKQTGLIQSNTDWGAGYFGVQTLTSLQEDYPEKFEFYRAILKEDEPIQGDRYFYVTAYYSPLPGQKRYTTGSYWGDVRLNGEGKHTASGKQVFPGLLAAPRNYDFGTKIELEGIGVGSVEDRGGAIVNAGERGHDYDRIDIWMGYGDAGLQRALKWGKRKVKGKVVSEDRVVSVQFSQSPVENYSHLYVTPESKGIDVEKLQKLFTELDLYSGDLDGKYISIKDDLIDFQLQHKIISSKYDEQAGYFGKRTIAALEAQYGNNGDIFIEPITIKPINRTYVLTRREKEEVLKIKNKIDSVLEQNYKGDKKKIKNKKTQLQKKIKTILSKVKNKKQKAQLEYLSKIL